MRVVINGMDTPVKWAEAKVSLDEMTRQFTIKNTEDFQSIFKGDEVELYNNVGTLIVKGDVEYIGLESEREFIYAGRNNAKYIVDCYADKTIQFSESQSVQSVLEEVAGWFDLKVIGTARMPKEAVEKILIGDELGESFIKIAKNSGQVLTSDAEGNIVIESEPKQGDVRFVYGENIRSRSFKMNTTNEYDRYIVVSQSNKDKGVEASESKEPKKKGVKKKKKQDVDIQGEYGSGKFVKVIKSEDNLTKAECEELAKKEYEKDRRKSVEYEVEVDAEIDVDVNVEYLITDTVAGIEMYMNVKEFVMTLDDDTDKLVVVFEKRRQGEDE